MTHKRKGNLAWTENPDSAVQDLSISNENSLGRVVGADSLFGWPAQRDA